VATERAAWLGRRYGATVQWRSFDLHPEYPPEGIARAELEARYGGEDWRESLWKMFDAAGLPYTRELDRVPNSRRALLLSELARDRGRFEALHERLFAAYWAEGRDIGADDVLVAEGVAAGLDEPDVRAALTDERYLERVQRDTAEAARLGAGGVPAWVVDERLLVPGAQPHAVFDRAMEQLGHAPREEGEG
jgi:predicted DsbA family dithiol-disulfide isomerase